MRKKRKTTGEREKTRIQKNATKIKWFSTKDEQDRRPYEIARNRANAIYEKKRMREWRKI